MNRNRTFVRSISSAFLGTCDTRDDSDPLLAGLSSRVACVVDICGPTDLTQDLSKQVPQGDWGNKMIKKLLGATAAEFPAAARRASPLYLVDAKSAPFFIAHGRSDPLVPLSHSERLDAALRKAGVESTLYAFDGGHEFKDGVTVLSFGLQMTTLLQRHLRP